MMCRELAARQLEQRLHRATNHLGDLHLEQEMSVPEAERQPVAGPSQVEHRVMTNEACTEDFDIHHLMDRNTLPKLTDEDFARGSSYSVPFPDATAGQPINGIPGITSFESMHRHHEESRTSPYYPFPDRDEWLTGVWMTKNLSQTQMDGMLQLPAVRPIIRTPGYDLIE